MDEKDLTLLQVLAEDGRASHVTLGKIVDLSEGAVRGRLDWLQANEILLGFQAVIKPGVLDPHLLQLVEFVILSGSTPETMKRFETALAALPGDRQRRCPGPVRLPGSDRSWVTREFAADGGDRGWGPDLHKPGADN